MIEEADKVKYQGKKLAFGDTGAYAFGYYRGRMRIIKEQTHGDIQVHYSDMNPEYNSGILVPVDEKIRRGDLGYPGRIWTKQKVISFWRYPEDGDKLREILSDINRELKERYGKTIDWKSGWKIEIVDESLSGKGTRKINRKELVDIENYIGSGERSKEDLARGHMDPDIGAGGVDKGTYQLKKQKGKKMDRYSGGGETKKLGYRVGDDPEYNDEIERFREVVREVATSLLKETPNEFEVPGEEYEELSIVTPGALAFGLYDGRFKTSDHFNKAHGTSISVRDNVDEMKEGRAWLEDDVISFWWQPSREEVKRVINELEKHAKEKFGMSVDIDGEWFLHYPTSVISHGRSTHGRSTGEYVTVKLKNFEGSGSQTFDKYSDREGRHADPDIGAGGVDKGTYQLKKQKGKEMDRYSGGGETKKLGYRVGDDPEYSDEIERFREVVKEAIKKKLE